MEYPTILMSVTSRYILSWIPTILESIKLLATNFPMNENLAQTLSATSDGVLGPNTPKGTAQLHIGSHDGWHYLEKVQLGCVQIVYCLKLLQGMKVNTRSLISTVTLTISREWAIITAPYAEVSTLYLP